MRTVYIYLTIILVSLNSYGQEKEFGRITITPYIATESGINGESAKLLKTKLNQIVTIGEVTGGFDQRFIITPTLNILSESTTASIPQKTSLKVSFMFFVGDGVAGSLFGSSNIEVVGVGNNHEEAVYSAIRKINIHNKDIQSLIAESKTRIIKFYNTVGSSLIKEAEGYIARNNYETALSKLAVIPAICQEYDKAQKLIIKCGSKILERDNLDFLTKAKAIWSANPNEDGAREASKYISQISVSSSAIKTEVNRLTNQMRERLIQIENQEIELSQAKIISEERLKIEQINASERTTSSFFGILPNLVYNILRWF